MSLRNRYLIVWIFILLAAAAIGQQNASSTTTPTPTPIPIVTESLKAYSSLALRQGDVTIALTVDAETPVLGILATNGNATWRIWPEKANKWEAIANTGIEIRRDRDGKIWQVEYNSTEWERVP